MTSKIKKVYVKAKKQLREVRVASPNRMKLNLQRNIP
jgi:hypothetical protein